jgi:hypothetical protein
VAGAAAVVAAAVEIAGAVAAVVVAEAAVVAIAGNPGESSELDNNARQVLSNRQSCRDAFGGSTRVRRAYSRARLWYRLSPCNQGLVSFIHPIELLIR